ncbi:MAG: antitoxin [Candidatus Thermoplasmatota archaeon]|jgi:predicted CopG family antitoxin|nr:antitoxin [Candidatus Sysuiplasma jiujiangense]MCL4317031.1 antitoxin [Candidatus Thermoplasmatota archaeon]MCL5253120.1 antitoxin [Candidatus Thermoplasmatota archaeon]
MATKNISITNEAYESLKRERRGNESFTEVILRLAHTRGSLSDCFGIWKLTDHEETKINMELSKGWQAMRERIRNEVP